jgi:hypothetical protein
VFRACGVYFPPETSPLRSDLIHRLQTTFFVSQPQPLVKWKSSLKIDTSSWHALVPDFRHCIARPCLVVLATTSLFRKRHYSALTLQQIFVWPPPYYTYGPETRRSEQKAERNLYKRGGGASSDRYLLRYTQSSPLDISLVELDQISRVCFSLLSSRGDRADYRSTSYKSFSHSDNFQWNGLHSIMHKAARFISGRMKHTVLHIAVPSQSFFPSSSTAGTDLFTSCSIRLNAPVAEKSK